MKRLLVAALLFSLCFPEGFVFAETNSEKALKEDLQDKVVALRAYVKRVTPINVSDVTTVLSDATMREVISNGVAWLRASQEESGHFAYEYLPYEDSYREDDNIVRQAGALYALSEVARRDTATNADTNKAIEQAISFFEEVSPEHEYKDVSVRCVAKNERSKVCALGATALALTGIVGYIKSQPEKANDYKELVEGYKSFILAAQKPAGGFRNEYKIGSGFRSEKESSFSNGEALLALVRYYQYKPDADVKKSIDSAFTYLKGTPFDTALYLWIMAALKDMNVMWPNDAYTVYAKAYTSWRLSLLGPSHNTVRNYCASTEGLASAYSLLQGKITESERTRLRAEIDFWNIKNHNLQIQTQDVYRLVFDNNKPLFKKVYDMGQSAGGFLTADDELTERIDFTQHCITTYLQTLVDIDGKSL